MTLAEIRTLLLTTGYPVAYRAFVVSEETAAPVPPYIVYYSNGIDPFWADGIKYYGAERITIELVTKDKDLTAESAVETALLGLTYSKSETFLDGEQVNQITYELEV